MLFTERRCLTIVTPVYNDWASFFILVKHLNALAQHEQLRIRILAVDDGSEQSPSSEAIETLDRGAIERLSIVHLALNMGHQRALAIGICCAIEEPDTSSIIVMDADGEDNPVDIPRMLAAAAAAPGTVLVAKRAKRSERLSFRVFYRIYKSLFRLLTGKTVNFGNFSLLSREQAQRLSMVPELWNNLPAAVMRSRLPITALSTARGKRYAGHSHMNFVALTLHGMSAYSVYTDAILVRLLIGTICFTGFSALVSVVVIMLRLFTSHATPGWATTVIFGLGIIASQATFTTLMSALLLLNARSQKAIIPAAEYRQYVRDVVVVGASA